MSEAQSIQLLYVLSNAPWFQGRSIGERPIQTQRIPESGPFGTIWAFFTAGRFDVAVFNNNLPQLVIFCLLARFWPGRRRWIVSVDPVLPRPRSRYERVRLAVVRFLLKRVDLFLVYFKDTHGMEDVYGIDRRKIGYVPFKINDYQKVTTHATCDEGFVLTCGRSKRDYATFGKALEDLPYAAHILAPAIDENQKHGTTFDFQTLPANVRHITDDGSHDSWMDWISRCTCVVLPVLPDTLAPSGISTYLVAMAMGKAVLMTDSPATRGLIDNGQAVIVPPSDPAALRKALIRVFENEDYRLSVADCGKKYALELGGEDRLAADITTEVGRLLNTPKIEDAGAVKMPHEVE